MEFRPLTETDLSLLSDWLNRPHLQTWWREGEVTLDAVREKYLPRIMGEGDARPFLALEGREPVGFIQVYRADMGSSDWWPDQPGFGVFGIDQFLADGNRLGRDLGTRMVRAFTDRLLGAQEFVARTFNEQRFLTEPAIEIRTDPRPDNVRAIRCYEKVGFRRTAEITTPDGPAVLMVLSAGTPEASNRGEADPTSGSGARH